MRMWLSGRLINIFFFYVAARKTREIDSHWTRRESATLQIADHHATDWAWFQDGLCLPVEIHLIYAVIRAN